MNSRPTGMRRYAAWNPVREEKSMSRSSELKFKNMNILQKIVHIGKICIFVLTLGFAYPNILLD